MTLSRFYDLMGATVPFDPTHRYLTSPIPGLTPLILAAIRLFFALYAFTTLTTSLVWFAYVEHNTTSARRTFSYFTYLAYWGLACYMAVSAVETGSYAWWLRQQSNTRLHDGRSEKVEVENVSETSTPPASLNTFSTPTTLPATLSTTPSTSLANSSWLHRLPRPLQTLHALFRTTVITLPFLVSIVFWAVLFRPGSFVSVEDTWNNVSVHGINSFFAGIELLCTRGPPPAWLHLAFVVLILALYLGLAYITLATQGWYTYIFLDPSWEGAGHVVGYIVAILVGTCAVFAVVWGVCWGRMWVCRRHGRDEDDVRAHMRESRVETVPAELITANAGKKADDEKQTKEPAVTSDSIV